MGRKYCTCIRKALQLYHVHPTSYSLTTDDALPLLEELDDEGEIYKGLPASDEFSDRDSYYSKKQSTAQLTRQRVYSKSLMTLHRKNLWICTEVMVIWKHKNLIT